MLPEPSTNSLAPCKPVPDAPHLQPHSSHRPVVRQEGQAPGALDHAAAATRGFCVGACVRVCVFIPVCLRVTAGAALAAARGHADGSFARSDGAAPTPFRTESLCHGIAAHARSHAQT
eukprot:6205471-Pleurochrysis_carterae.AAC.1